mmetsp:Transcript_82040/g.183021  ORF Transcript_82040/g.183021 Transcript_82040/m.183021 type:complete len:428 (+) Transcript_82040:326-1609(+)
MASMPESLSWTPFWFLEITLSVIVAVAEGWSRNPTSLSAIVFAITVTCAESLMEMPVTPGTPCASPPRMVFLRTDTWQSPCMLSTVSSLAEDESSQCSIMICRPPLMSIAEPQGSRGFVLLTLKPRSSDPLAPSSMQMRPLITGASLDLSSVTSFTRLSMMSCSAYGSALGRTSTSPWSNWSFLPIFCIARRIVEKLSGTIRIAGSSSRDTGALRRSRHVFCNLFHPTFPAKRRFRVAAITHWVISFSKPSKRMTVSKLALGQQVQGRSFTESGCVRAPTLSRSVSNTLRFKSLFSSCKMSILLPCSWACASRASTRLAKASTAARLLSAAARAATRASAWKEAASSLAPEPNTVGCPNDRGPPVRMPPLGGGIAAAFAEAAMLLPLLDASPVIGTRCRAPALPGLAHPPLDGRLGAFRGEASEPEL